MSSPKAESSDDENAILNPTERAILEERVADLDDEEKLLTVEELRSRFD